MYDHGWHVPCLVSATLIHLLLVFMRVLNPFKRRQPIRWFWMLSQLLSLSSTSATAVSMMSKQATVYYIWLCRGVAAWIHKWLFIFGIMVCIIQSGALYGILCLLLSTTFLYFGNSTTGLQYYVTLQRHKGKSYCSTVSPSTATELYQEGGHQQGYTWLRLPCTIASGKG